MSLMNYGCFLAVKPEGRNRTGAFADRIPTSREPKGGKVDEEDRIISSTYPLSLACPLCLQYTIPAQ